MKPLFIAEVKTQSPFGFHSDRCWDDLFELAIEHADIVAIHTDKPWGGCPSDIARARYYMEPNPHKLLLAKGYHHTDDDIRQSLSLGADLVLVVGRIPPPELAPVCIWEPANLNEIVAAKDPAQKIMWNERDLSTGLRRRDADFTMARWSHKGWMAQASFITEPKDVHPKATAFIVGEHLPTFVEAL